MLTRHLATALSAVLLATLAIGVAATMTGPGIPGEEPASAGYAAQPAAIEGGNAADTVESMALLITSANATRLTELTRSPVRVNDGFYSDLMFSADGHTLLTGGYVWAVGGSEVEGSPLRAAVLTPDGQAIISVKENGGSYGLYRSDLAGGSLEYLMKTPRLDGITISADGGLVAGVCCDSDKRGQPVVAVYSLTEDRVLFEHPQVIDVTAVAFSTRGSLLATGNSKGQIMLREVATGKAIRTLTSHSDMITGLDFSGNGAELASSSADATIRVWNLADGEAVLVLTEHSDVVSDSQTGQFSLVIEEHGDMFDAVSFSPDGSLIASVGRDGTLRLWDAASGRELNMMYAPSDTDILPWMTGVAFSPEGNLLAASGADGWIHVYGVPGL